jgi:hypothetical protein
MIDKSVFTRLKRLFSSDVIVRNVGGDQLRTVDVDKVQSLGIIHTNSLVDRFTKLYSTTGTGIYNLNNVLNYQTLRLQLYTDYESMDQDAIIASTLDIIADECTLKNEAGEVLQIRSADENIQKILYNLFYDILNIEFNLWMWIRNMCKYGDFYLKLDIAEEFGVYNVIPYSAYNIIREEGTDPGNPSYVRFRYDPNGLAGGTSGYARTLIEPGMANGETINFENYEMIHFRLIADANYLPYGRAYIEPARKIWKQMVLMEDAMLVHRIMRAPERRVFTVNVGTIPPDEVDAYMQKIIAKQKKTPYVDPQTGNYNLKFNMMNMMEDFYLPVRGNDTTTKIDTLAGLEYNGIEDVSYLRDKLFAALKVPKAFMGYEKDLTGKATLAAEDIRFARTVERIQRIILSELNKIALVHLYTQGYEGESLTNFELNLTTPSVIYDQERIALMKEKVDLAVTVMDNNLLSSDWIYDKIFHFSEDQFDEIRDQILEDKKRQFRQAQIENEGNDPAESGESYGTPHDLAALYGKGRMGSGDVPEGYNEDEPQISGRPVERASDINTQDNPFGKDRMGVQGMKVDDQGEQGQLLSKSKIPQPLSLESAKITFLKNKKLFESIPRKKLIIETKSEKMLDESNLLPEEPTNDE